MPRTFRIERDAYAVDQAIFLDPSRPPPLSRPLDRDSASNAELAHSNQKLQGKLQRLAAAYQAVEQQNVALRDRCLRLQNRVEELKAYLHTIKTDVGERVEPMRVIARHLMDMADFMEELDHSIRVTDPSDHAPPANLGNVWNGIPPPAASRPSGRCEKHLSPIAEDPWG